jgi:uncharacterized protein YegL
MKLSVTAALSFAFLSASSLQALAASQQTKDRVEVVFVLDTTGSMGELIEGAKRKIWSIASTVVDTNPNADIAMGLVAYRDRGDDYVIQSNALSEDVQGLYGKLIKLQAEGGGDGPESVNEALDTAVSKMNWTSGTNVKRIVFLVGDAPPHMDYEQERQYPAILKTAAKADIVVNAVQAGNEIETTQIWQEIAQFGNGRFIAIPQSGGQITIVITPYDNEILDIQRRLDQSVLPYGTREKQAETKTKMEEKAAAPSSVQLDNSEYYSKRLSKREVVTGGGDLIADIANKAVKLDEIDKEELPKELLGKSSGELEEWVKIKQSEREKLEVLMAEQITKRDAFVAAEQAKTAKTGAADSFDTAVEDTLKDQLK